MKRWPLIACIQQENQLSSWSSTHHFSICITLRTETHEGKNNSNEKAKCREKKSIKWTDYSECYWCATITNASSHQSINIPLASSQFHHIIGSNLKCGLSFSLPRLTFMIVLNNFVLNWISYHSFSTVVLAAALFRDEFSTVAVATGVYCIVYSVRGFFFWF